MAKTLIIALMLLPLLAMFGCQDKDRAAVAEVQKLFDQNLKPGDPDSKIVALFKQHNIPYDFDRFGFGYQSTIPASRKTDWKGVESVITIYVHLNQDRSFKSVDVRMSYTWF